MTPMRETRRICPSCGAVVMSRDALTDLVIDIVEVVWCPHCGCEIGRDAYPGGTFEGNPNAEPHQWERP